MQTLFVACALLLLVQLVASQEKKSLTTNIDGADVYVADASEFKAQYLLGEPEIVNAVQQLVKVTQDARSLDWISSDNGNPALFKIQITITCCKPFKVTIEF